MKKNLIQLIIGGLILTIVGCSSNPKKDYEDKLAKMNLSNFDREFIAADFNTISRMISTLKPSLDPTFRDGVAKQIAKSSSKFKVEPQVIVALIDTESDFRRALVSSTGDISIAQVNVEIWNKEFERMGLPLIKKDKLKEEDQDYAIQTMAHILSILKSKYKKSDRRWYARYHSNTSKYKLEYLKRIEVRMKKLSRDKDEFVAIEED